MKYYLHDTGSFDDDKITELFLEYGYEGLGLFYTILEKLAKQEKPVKTVVLKSQLKVGKKLEKCWNFMESLGIICSNNGETFNKNILNNTEKFQSEKNKNSNRVKQWRDKQVDTENVTHYSTITESVTQPLRNAPKESKVKESKVNKRESDHLFTESKFFELSVFKEQFSDQKYLGVDLDDYHESMKNWSLSKNEKKHDWIATAKNWISRDKKSGKLVTTNLFSNAEQPKYSGKNAGRDFALDQLKILKGFK